VEVSNWINEFDQRNVVDSITRAKVRMNTPPFSTCSSTGSDHPNQVEQLLYEPSCPRPHPNPSP
jgi:hypothetical protein